MTKLKIKTGDTVKVIAGDHKGEEGKVVRVFIDKNRAIVEGVNMISKHTKPSAENPQGWNRQERSAASHFEPDVGQERRGFSRWVPHGRGQEGEIF